MRLRQRFQRDLKDERSRAEWVRFHEFLARWTVNWKARKVRVNQGLALDFLNDSLVTTGACLSSKDETVVLKAIKREPKDCRKAIWL